MATTIENVTDEQLADLWTMAQIDRDYELCDAADVAEDWLINGPEALCSELAGRSALLRCVRVINASEAQA